MIRNSITKIIAILTIVSLNWTGLSAVIGTVAYYNDAENSSGNSYSAGTLDFSLSPADGFSPNVTPTQSSSRTISVVKDGILGFEYTLQTENETGDLCDYLNLTASRDGTDIGYTGNLKDFNYNAGQFSDPDDWQFTATLTSSDAGLQNQTCNFDFVFDGSQISGAGFSDQETISNTITSGSWVKNTWTQTTKAEFDAGAKTNVITTNVAGGEVQLSSSTTNTGITSTGSTSYPTATIGTTTVLGSTAETQGNVSAQKVTVPTGGVTIQSVTIYWGAVSRAGSVRFAFYNNNAGTGNPSTLISGSDTGIVAVGTGLAGTWQTISYGTPFYLSAGTYWLARQATDPVDGKGPKRNYASTPAGPGRRVHTQAWGAFPDPFGTINTSDTLNESQYTTYVQIKGYAKATKVTLSDNADITSMSFYSHTTGNFRLAIYSNSSGPSSRLWESGSTAATASSWNTVNIASGTPTSLALTTGTYWLAWQWDSANSGPSYTAGSCGDGNYISQAYGSFPVTWSGGTSSSEKWSIYATYTKYTITGTLVSQSFDSEGSADWQSLEWDETLPSGTDITFEVCTSNTLPCTSWWAPTPFDKDSPIDLNSLSETRYIKWKATLTTSDTSKTPVLSEVRVKYYPGLASEHIVLNEFLPNPSGTDPDYGFDFGEDNDLMPKGEWVEIYNKAGGKAVDLAGWYIEEQEGNIVEITSSNTNTGSTVIGANGSGNEWLVVYMNGEILNNNSETIYLYDMFDNLIDSYSYDLSGYCNLEPTSGEPNDETPSGDCPTEIPGNKSYARIPDGTGIWYDPIPTPGSQNKLEEIVVEENQIIEEAPIDEEETTIIIIDEAFISAPFINTSIEEEAPDQEEIISDEEIITESATAEETVESDQNTETVEEPIVTSETGNPEDTVSEEQPATEEQPVIGPVNDSSGQVLPIDATTADTGGANNGSDGASTDTVVAADTGSSGESAVVE